MIYSIILFIKSHMHKFYIPFLQLIINQVTENFLDRENWKNPSHTLEQILGLIPSQYESCHRLAEPEFRT